ncbi:MAG TPA: M1 family aminopeptidase [Candidatus Kapabacteria bacterium]|nr:M1 family aminopeptidase [Candidatus Kapabacteria bacterium]
MSKFAYILVIIIITFPYVMQSKNLYNNAYENKTQPFDVLSYDLLFDISSNDNFLQRQMKGINKINVKWDNRDTTNRFFFSLKDNLKIDSIYKNGHKIQFYKNDSEEPLEQYYYINKLDTLLESEFTIFYGGKMTSENENRNWGGVHYKLNILFNLGVTFFDPNVSAAHYWMPCYDHPLDKATFKAEYITPSNIVVASNGKLISEEIIDGKKHTIWQQTVPSATYLMNFAMSEFTTFSLNTPQIPITVYTFPSDSSRSTIVYSKVNEMLQYFSEKFSDYEFEKVGYVNTPIGSMEHQTMISLDRAVMISAAYTKDSVNATVAHELSHSWFGNMVSPKDFRDVWFNESFASHSEALWADYISKTYPWLDKSYNQAISKQWNDYIDNIVSSEGILPLYNFKNYQKDLTNKISYDLETINYPTTIYLKGSVIVNHLRNEIGHNKFDSIMKVILIKYKNSNISTQDLLNELNTHSGINLNTFFNEWVYQAGFPILSIDYSLDNNKLFLNINQVQDEKIYGKYSKVKVPVLIKTNSNEYIKYYNINGKHSSIIDSIDNDNTIISIEINNSHYEISPIKYSLKLVSVQDEQTDNKYFYTLRNFSDKIIIDLNNNFDISSKYELLNLAGVSIKSDNLTQNNQIILNKTSLASGVYFLIVYSLDKQLNTIKIII